MGDRKDNVLNHRGILSKENSMNDAIVVFLICTAVYSLMFYIQHRRTVHMRDELLEKTR